jgi:hypothetical protein
MRNWAHALARWLPERAARDWFRPALHDLEAGWAHPRLTRGRWGRGLASLIRHALRQFRREPAFCAAAVLTLALGIGANTALFAVVEAVLLRPLPFADAERLVMLRHRDLRTGISKDS